MSESVGQFGYERLGVWQKAVGFAGDIYTVTRAFPREELLGLVSQMRRSRCSIAANIAEGASRSSGKDQARFFEIAYGSLNEVVTMLHIAEQQAFLSEDDLRRLRSDALAMCRMLSGLKRSALGQSG